MTEKTGLAAARRFVWHRFVRVVPLYWLWTTVLLIAMVSGVALANTKLTAPWVFASYTFLPYERVPGQTHPILDQGWTLSFELYFYIVGGLTIITLPTRQRLLGLVAVMVSSQVLTVAAGVRGAWVALLGSSLIYEFQAGALIAWWVRFASAPPAGLSARLALLLVVASLVWFALSVTPLFDDMPRFVSWGIPSVLLVIAAVASNKPITNRIEQGLFALGTASYSLYLTHTLATVTLGGILKRGLLQGVEPSLLTIGASLLIIVGGSASYWIVEKPLLGLFRRRSARPLIVASKA